MGSGGQDIALFWCFYDELLQSSCFGGEGVILPGSVEGALGLGRWRWSQMRALVAAGRGGGGGGLFVFGENHGDVS